MGGNIVPFIKAVEEKCTSFIYNHYKFIEIGKIEKGTLLNHTIESRDRFDCHHTKCGGICFEKLN